MKMQNEISTANEGVDSRAIANIFIEESKKLMFPHTLTQMNIVRYVYFAHGWVLGYTNKPLINQSIYAWKWGPVIQELYHTMKNKHRYIMSEPIIDEKTGNPYVANLSEHHLKLTLDVFEKYSKVDNFELSYACHHPESPWCACTNGGRNFYDEISTESITAYYKTAIDKIKSQGHENMNAECAPA